MKRAETVAALLGAMALGGARGQVTKAADQAAPMLARNGSVTGKVADYAAAQARGLWGAPPCVGVPPPDAPWPLNRLAAGAMGCPA